MLYATNGCSIQGQGWEQEGAGGQGRRGEAAGQRLQGAFQNYVSTVPSTEGAQDVQDALRVLDRLLKRLRARLLQLCVFSSDAVQEHLTDDSDIDWDALTVLDNTAYDIVLRYQGAARALQRFMLAHRMRPSQLTDAQGLLQLPDEVDVNDVDDEDDWHNLVLLNGSPMATMQAAHRALLEVGRISREHELDAGDMCVLRVDGLPELIRMLVDEDLFDPVSDDIRISQVALDALHVFDHVTRNDIVNAYHEHASELNLTQMDVDGTMNNAFVEDDDQTSSSTQNANSSSTISAPATPNVAHGRMPRELQNSAHGRAGARDARPLRTVKWANTDGARPLTQEVPFLPSSNTLTQAPPATPRHDRASNGQRSVRQPSPTVQASPAPPAFPAFPAFPASSELDAPETPNVRQGARPPRQSVRASTVLNARSFPQLPRSFAQVNNTARHQPSPAPTHAPVMAPPRFDPSGQQFLTSMYGKTRLPQPSSRNAASSFSRRLVSGKDAASTARREDAASRRAAKEAASTAWREEVVSRRAAKEAASTARRSSIDATRAAKSAAAPAHHARDMDNFMKVFSGASRASAATASRTNPWTKLWSRLTTGSRRR